MNSIVWILETIYVIEINFQIEWSNCVVAEAPNLNTVCMYTLIAYLCVKVWFVLLVSCIPRHRMWYSKVFSSKLATFYDDGVWAGITRKLITECNKHARSGFPNLFDKWPPCRDNGHSATPPPSTYIYHDHDNHFEIMASYLMVFCNDFLFPYWKDHFFLSS